VFNPVSLTTAHCKKLENFSNKEHMISNLGKGALCGKIDIKSAFRLLIVSPSDFDLVGIYFDGKFYIDKCLPIIKPDRDSKCLTFTFFLRIMGCNIDLSLSIFSCGIRIIIKSVSISNPKYRRTVVGPVVLFSANGTPIFIANEIQSKNKQ
jgi:hypothetical protein